MLPRKGAGALPRTGTEARACELGLGLLFLAIRGSVAALNAGLCLGSALLREGSAGVWMRLAARRRRSNNSDADECHPWDQRAPGVKFKAQARADSHSEPGHAGGRRAGVRRGGRAPSWLVEITSRGGCTRLAGQAAHEGRENAMGDRVVHFASAHRPANSTMPGTSATRFFSTWRYLPSPDRQMIACLLAGSHASLGLSKKSTGPAEDRVVARASIKPLFARKHFVNPSRSTSLTQKRPEPTRVSDSSVNPEQHRASGPPACLPRTTPVAFTCLKRRRCAATQRASGITR